MEKLSFRMCVVVVAIAVHLLLRKMSACSADVTHPQCSVRYITKSDGVSLRPHLMTSSCRGSRSHRATGPRSRSQPRAWRCSGGGRCLWQSRRSPPSPGCPGHWCLNKVIIRADNITAEQHSAHHVASLNLCLLYIAVYNVCDVVIALAFCLSDNIQCCLIPQSAICGVDWVAHYKITALLTAQQED